MPFYPEELVEEVRMRNDIVDVISQEVRLQKRGNTYVGLCPFHNEKTPSFTVSAGKQMYYCFGCGAGGNVIGFVKAYHNYSFPEAMEMLAERAGIALPKQELSQTEKRREDRRTRLFEVYKMAAAFYYKRLRSEVGTTARRYFEERQLSPETMNRFGLGYSGKYGDELYHYLRKCGYEDELLKDSGLISFDEKRGGRDKFWNRAMFPIMDPNKRVIGFGGRVMGQGEPKYLNSPETMIFDKSKTLYGLHIARASKRPGFLLCEGYMDVIALHQAGFDNAVASLGTAFTQGHANLLKRFTREVYLTFDSDGAGKKAALRAIPILKEAGISAKVISLAPYKDPDELIKAEGAEGYQRRIDEAQNSFLFEITVLQEQYDLRDPKGKTDFYKAVAAKLREFEVDAERNNYLNAVAGRFRIPVADLRALVATEGMVLAGNSYGNREPYRSGIHSKSPLEELQKDPQSLFLSRLAEFPQLYPKVKKKLQADYFSPEIFRILAEALLTQLEEGKADPAGIIETLSEDRQQEATAIFHCPLLLTDQEELTEARIERELQRALITIRESYYKRKSAELEKKGLPATEFLPLWKENEAFRKDIEQDKKIWC